MAALKGPRVEPEGEAKRLVVFVHGYGANGTICSGSTVLICRRRG